MWSYKISTGELFDKNNKLIARGYSGKGVHKNKIESTSIKSLGPLPVGKYSISAPRKSEVTGPYAMDLVPAKENNMFGRSAFQIHGDSIREPGTASTGCIIMPRNIRELVWASGDRDLTVVA